MASPVTRRPWRTRPSSNRRAALCSLVLSSPPLGTAACASVRPDSCASSESRCTAFWRPSTLPRADLPSRAYPSGLGGPARETESVNQRDVLVLSPLTDSRVTLRAAHDGATH